MKFNNYKDALNWMKEYPIKHQIYDEYGNYFIWGSTTNSIRFIYFEDTNSYDSYEISYSENDFKNMFDESKDNLEYITVKITISKNKDKIIEDINKTIQNKNNLIGILGHNKLVRRFEEVTNVVNIFKNKINNMFWVDYNELIDNNDSFKETFDGYSYDDIHNLIIEQELLYNYLDNNSIIPIKNDLNELTQYHEIGTVELWEFKG